MTGNTPGARMPDDLAVGGIGIDGEHDWTGCIHLMSADDHCFAECGVLLGAGCPSWEVGVKELSESVDCRRCRKTKRFLLAVVPVLGK